MSDDKDSDYDFDFSKYENEEQNEHSEAENVNAPAPKVSGYRSRYSNFAIEAEQLGFMKSEVLKYSIKTASNTQDITDLWNHYGTLYSYWDCFKDIFGSNIQNQINAYLNKCRKVLQKYQGYDKEIPYSKCHSWLLETQGMLFKYRQVSNLGFEVEKSYRGHMGRSKSKIIEG